MKYLNRVLEANEIEKELAESAAASYLAAKERLRELPLALNEDAELILSNHIMALIKRIREGKLIDPIEEEMMGELSEKAWEYAGILVEPLFTEAGIREDRSELFLVGTHMEMALADR